MSLQAKLDAFKADFEAGKPPYSVPRSVIETMHRATDELIESGAAQLARKAGDVAPSFSLSPTGLLMRRHVAWASPTSTPSSRASRAPRRLRTAERPSRFSICGRSSRAP